MVCRGDPFTLGWGGVHHRVPSHVGGTAPLLQKLVTRPVASRVAGPAATAAAAAAAAGGTPGTMPPLRTVFALSMDLHRSAGFA